jgi:hypothetical protein
MKLFDNYLWSEHIKMPNFVNRSRETTLIKGLLMLIVIFSGITLKRPASKNSFTEIVIVGPSSQMNQPPLKITRHR